MSEVTRNRAELAKEKKALFGTDVDLRQYELPADNKAGIVKPESLSEEDRKKIISSGVDLADPNRAGTFLQADHRIVHCAAKQPGLEVLPMAEALEKHPWLEKFYWQAVHVDADKYTAQAELHFQNGYFIRAQAGQRVTTPIQACLYMRHENTAQNVHNIIIAEEGSELHIITGCATAPSLKSGLHIGISEIYVQRGAKLTFTMIHDWAEEVMVRPRSGIVVEENGVFLSNYVCLKPVRSLQMYPTTRLTGPGATARFHSVLLAPPGCELDTGARVILEAPQTRAEIIARTITTGGSIKARGHLRGLKPDVKAHLECHGLILAEDGVIHAIPELEGQTAGAEMSHEAAVGKIAEEEIEYLMARGLTEEEATSTIVRGFMNVRIEGLPPELQAEVDRAIEESEMSML
ncbi:MAG: SufD family Fe-S cluster assembly protein [Deltaproteobacteria bacterium]|nr:MAG: SufD family Fe-S cluster assembly protein [Deltaproteobacteria bacterium]